MLLFIPVILSCTREAAGQTMLFSDEFNSTSLDTVKWAQCYDDRSGDMRYSNWPNGEAQWYKPANNVVANGYLSQIAKKEDTQGKDRVYNYSSGIITSHKSFNFSYGYFVARVWLCPGNGFWPALWIWPRGEIDAFEFYGDNVKRIYMTNHGQGRGHAIGISDDWTKGWHIIGTDWQADSIRFYIDDVLLGTCGGPSSAKQYLILNLAIANGKGAPVPNENTVFPSAIKWDWIRVYSKYVRLIDNAKSNETK